MTLESKGRTGRRWSSQLTGQASTSKLGQSLEPLENDSPRRLVGESRVSMRGYKTEKKITPIIGPLDGQYELFDLLDALKPEVLKYRWSVSDVELSHLPDATIDINRLVAHSPQEVLWVSGIDLYEWSRSVIISNWGAFLAFKPEQADFRYVEVPYSEGRPPSIQHAEAQIEIQAVDGAYFEVYSKIPRVIALLKQHFVVESVESMSGSA